MQSLLSARKYTYIIVLFLLSFVFYGFAFADVPRDKLVVEYMFNGGVADTSGNVNAVANFGATFATDPAGPIQYASFVGTSQIIGLTGWSTTTSSFAVSFWIKTPISGRNQTTAQNLFSSRRTGGNASDIALTLDKDYNCILIPTNTKVDCTALKDEQWHNVVLKKDDFGDLSFYIDGAKIDYLQASTFAFGKSISLGDSSTFTGKIAAFRLYRADLNQTAIDALYDEFPLLHTAVIVNPQVPVITIADPDTDPESFKKITATTNIGTLEMSVDPNSTTSSRCNSSKTFEPYNPMTFNSVADNGTRVCYRATNGTNVTYKFSNRIYGISTESTIISTENIFSDNAYLAWPSSRKKNPADFMFNIIDRISSQGVSFVDINGDGLIDTLYADNNYKALLVNNGDYTFRVAYKCYFNSVTKDYYYGDCANTSYKN